ncbi:hypothetical protein STEG23_014448 [Scotinomys teguina]
MEDVILEYGGSSRGADTQEPHYSPASSLAPVEPESSTLFPGTEYVCSRAASTVHFSPSVRVPPPGRSQLYLCSSAIHSTTQPAQDQAGSTPQLLLSLAVLSYSACISNTLGSLLQLGCTFTDSLLWDLYRDPSNPGLYRIASYQASTPLYDPSNPGASTKLQLLSTTPPILERLPSFSSSLRPLQSWSVYQASAPLYDPSNLGASTEV